MIADPILVRTTLSNLGIFLTFFALIEIEEETNLEDILRIHEIFISKLEEI